MENARFRLTFDKDMMISSPDFAGAKPTKSSPMSKNLSEAVEALTVLGYDKNSILSAIKDMSPATEVGNIIKAALKKLAR